LTWLARFLRSLLRSFLIWGLPTIVLLLVLASALLFWCVASQTGTRLLLTTAAAQFGGQAENINGSVLGGMQIGRLHMKFPGADVDIVDARLDVAWKELLKRRLHIRELVAGAIHLQLEDRGAAPKPATESSGVPALPLDIVADRVAVGTFSLLQNGVPLPITLGSLDAALAAGPNGATLHLASLHVGHPMAQTDLQGDVQLQTLNDPWPFKANLKAVSPVCLDTMLTRYTAPAAAKPSPAAAVPAAPKPSRSSGAGSARKRSRDGDTAVARKRSRATAAAAPKQSRATSVPANAAITASTIAAASTPSAATSTPAKQCGLVVTTRGSGSLNAIALDVNAQGSGATAVLHTELTPGGAFVLRRAQLDLTLADRSSVHASVDWQTGQGTDASSDHVTGTLTSRDLDLSRVLGAAVPEAHLSADGAFELDLHNHQALDRAKVDLTFAPGSKWNKQPLLGRIHALVGSEPASPAVGRPASPAAVAPASPTAGALTSPRPGAFTPPPAGTPAASIDPMSGFQIENLDVDLTLGRNRVRASGNLGLLASSLKLDAEAPQLASFWPGLTGGASAKGEIAGTIASHRGAIDARYTPAQIVRGKLGKSLAEASLTFSGGWGKGASGQNDAALTGWRGNLSSLTASHAGFSVAVARPIDLRYLPEAAAPLWQWQVGAATVIVGFPNNERMTLAHAGSRGAAGRWETAGAVDNAVISSELVSAVMAAVNPEAQRPQTPGINGKPAEASRRIALDASWDLKFAGALAGRVHLQRRSGDLLIPGDPPVPLGLRQLAVDVIAKPVNANSSRLDATLDLQTAKMGRVNATGSAVLVSSKESGFALDPRQPVHANVNADIADLGFIGIFTGDSTEAGGAVKADVDITGTVGGAWHTNGTVRGEKLRIVRLDDGVRLMDGTLSARLADDTVYLDSLRFPATLRVMPDEKRTKTWITEDPDAKNGYIEAKGQWGLTTSKGDVRIALHRFPILQRSDRYGMVSGNIDIDAALPRIAITGDVRADAGWVSLEILQSVPTLDDDVHVVRATDPPPAAQSGSPMQLSLNLKYDMGPRFYITGMGLDAGLVGNIQIVMEDGRLSGEGQLRTRGGRIESYGQKLQLRRGTLTFQGRLDNPILDIEALRTGAQVEAGVRVSGTAQRPRIDLVSYPDVSDVEKLSWLVLGRAPDEGGSDTALLLSAGAALLGGGQPFYKQFGLDDVSVRSGAIGSSGSLLPDRTVASDVNSNSDSTLATQFLVASKNFANGIGLSVEQAMSGAGTVGLASYKLSRSWSANLKAGTVSGFSLVYRILFGG
jgi:translocation and assembly module TamB